MKTIAKIFTVAAILGLSSCVSMQKYKDLENKYQSCTDREETLDKKNQELQVDVEELRALTNRQKDQLKKLQNDYDVMAADYKRSTSDYDKLYADYQKMEEHFSKQNLGNRSEIQKLLTDLQAREAELKKLEEENEAKRASLDKLMVDLSAKEKMVDDLQAVLAKKDKELNSLRDKMLEALVGFKDKGLSVYTKDGKVYVSMDEKLLFASGSWKVADEGAQALKEVGIVLQKNPDINIMIEGHTDNVPYQGRGEVKDNWDLSVLRATSIVKILLENKSIAANRITAAGRGEYIPLVSNTSKENKAKNRRTEIILTPKLDEIYQILEK